MKKVFVSLPMYGRTEEQIREEMEWIRGIVEEEIEESVELVDTYISEDPPKEFQKDRSADFYILKSLEMLKDADIAVFAPGWENARGCRIERFASNTVFKVLPARLGVHGNLMFEGLIKMELDNSDRSYFDELLNLYHIEF